MSESHVPTDDLMQTNHPTDENLTDRNPLLQEQLLHELRRLNTNIEELIEAFRSVPPPKPPRIRPPKRRSLMQEDLSALQDRFEHLYEMWLDGHELEVQKELESLSVEDVRHLANANNLNVTSRTSKEKVLQLISIRFREKRMLTSNMTSTRPLTETQTLGEPPAE